MLERMQEPGAERSGFIRFEESTVTGPRLLEPEMVSVEVVLPTVKTLSKIAAGVLTDEQVDPELPAETTTTMPAARRFSTTVFMVAKLPVLHPSLTGHPQELLMTSGASAGFGFWPARFQGARNHWKHSM